MNCNYLQVHLLPYRIISFKYFFSTNWRCIIQCIKKLCQTGKTHYTYTRATVAHFLRVINLHLEELSWANYLHSTSPSPYCIQSHQSSSSFLSYLSILIPSLVFNPDTYHHPSAVAAFSPICFGLFTPFCLCQPDESVRGVTRVVITVSEVWLKWEVCTKRDRRRVIRPAPRVNFLSRGSCVY